MKFLRNHRSSLIAPTIIIPNENTIKIAKNLLEAGASVDLVVQGTKLPREEVEAIAKRLGKLIA